MAIAPAQTGVTDGNAERRTAGDDGAALGDRRQRRRSAELDRSLEHLGVAPVDDGEDELRRSHRRMRRPA